MHVLLPFQYRSHETEDLTMHRVCESHTQSHEQLDPGKLSRVTWFLPNSFKVLITQGGWINRSVSSFCILTHQAPGLWVSSHSFIMWFHTKFWNSQPHHYILLGEISQRQWGWVWPPCFPPHLPVCPHFQTAHWWPLNTVGSPLGGLEKAVGASRVWSLNQPEWAFLPESGLMAQRSHSP